MIDIVQCVVTEKIKGHGKALGFSKVISKPDVLIKEGGTDTQNRAFVSDPSIDILMNPELKQTKDTVHQRRSGLNHVLAKLAKRHHLAIGFGFASLLHTKDVARAQILGRMRQNVRICRQFKVPMVVCSYASNVKELRGAKDLLSFARLIGMNGSEAKQALHWKRPLKKIRIA